MVLVRGNCYSASGLVICCQSSYKMLKEWLFPVKIAKRGFTP